MDYSALAIEFFDKMHMLRKAKPQKHIDGALQGEAFALHYIASHGGEVVPGEIGNEMNVSTARIAQTLNSIERKGWITRQIDQTDRRRILVKLTPEGKSVEDAHYREIIGTTASMLSMLGEADAVEYIRIMGKLAEIVSRHSDQISF
ncbi:MAG: MarR family transcriptional regulator [Clostridiales bacterium]|nr:MarR family transcriptional regulator [Clostridiales bacterium]